MSLRPAFIFALSCLAAAAQTPQSNAPAAPHFTIKGRVVNDVTGEPVRGALVTVSGQEQHTGFSGSDGQFQIDGVIKGNAMISARHPGYSHHFQPGRVQTINISDNVDGVTVKMAPTARISGTVRDSDGEPVEGLPVNGMQEVVMNGRKHLQRTGGALTDEGGRFVLDNLQAGSYILGTSQKAVYPGVPAANQAARLMYAGQYYPKSPDLASAQKVDLKPGEDDHIDITVSEVQGVRVSFSVNPPTTAFVWGSLEGADGQTIRTAFQKNNKTGKFDVASVPPGSWTLKVNAQSQAESARGMQNTGEAVVDVGSTDVDNVQVDLSSPGEIPVIITGLDRTQGQPTTAPLGKASNRKTPVMQTPNIILEPDSSAPDLLLDRRYGMNISQTGSTIQNVPPGSYRALVATWGSECLDSITSGSLDLTRNDLVITSGSTAQPINVAFRSNCPELDITFNQKRDATAVIVGESRAIDPVAMPSGSAGAVTLASLPPGEYTIYAFTDVNGLEYKNPEVMRNFSGQHVTLTAGQKATVAVDVIEREAQ